jgi:carbonic anhydrase
MTERSEVQSTAHPATTIDQLFGANARYADTFAARAAGADISSPRPTRHTAVVCCMDARIDLFPLLGLRLGESHIIRNAGGIATDDVLRSLALSQRKLGTREVMVVHHTDCGLHGLDEAALLADIEADVGERPPFAFGAFADLDASVRDSVAQVRSATFLPHRDAVRGFVVDVATGRLREVV